ncbi:hypothetical protein AXF42_Ash007446 [Apostasia shenzhenica]|uniref:Uncharacterized protein n=1 Tax=Apostasia shenzhenica TaxID=1088818 RepID=A0A2I0BAA8_9ASPA|nr:hypothetical protein AXF42_Ash007446 [Apostasia shenzhenica]
MQSLIVDQSESRAGVNDYVAFNGGAVGGGVRSFHVDGNPGDDDLLEVQEVKGVRFATDQRGGHGAGAVDYGRCAKV